MIAFYIIILLAVVGLAIFYIWREYGKNYEKEEGSRCFVRN